MQTILGSTGTIGKGLAKSLTEYTNKIRLVSRNPIKINESDELFPADLLDRDQVFKAVENSEVVYLTAGLQYKIEVWRTQWPVVMKNVIDACETQKARLVFFDNVYSYGFVNKWMNEETPLKPTSKKGEVRKQLNEMLLNEIEGGKLEAMILRAADFYGPDTPFSVFNIMVLENCKKGKKAQWLIDDKKKHSFIYTPDAVKAMALLGNTKSAFNQVWVLPTDKNALTGKELIETSAKAFGVKPGHMVLSKWMVKALGFVIPELKESYEMLYQYENDYLVDSSKFDKAFDFKTTSYEDGIIETIKSMKK